MVVVEMMHLMDTIAVHLFIQRCILEISVSGIIHKEPFGESSITSGETNITSRESNITSGALSDPVLIDTEPQ